ncbi:hypothetical protein V8G54_022850 [Vigna mungo]|uniref:Uncharacterized protein n=1 Tax=Vigna mungo TaxID=3915 RepID=A0AAQ3RRM6_VIGMU
MTALVTGGSKGIGFISSLLSPHPLLKASEAASIIFISSIAGVVATNLASIVYSASKGAMNQMTKNLACEWAKDNIVNVWLLLSICFVFLCGKHLKEDRVVNAVISQTPLELERQCYISYTLIAFLCSPAASLHSMHLYLLFIIKSFGTLNMCNIIYYMN